MMARGRFLTFEGIDGAGKSTHVAWVPQWLAQHGVDVVATREPGGTPVGEALRSTLLNEPMRLDTEALLMFAARCEHVGAVVEPALEAGRWVVCDRFTDASFAYQGAGRGIAAHRLASLEQWIQPRLEPDCTFLFDLPAQVAAARRAAERTADRFEREDLAFFERVRGGYRARAKAASARFVVLDATEPVDALRSQIEHCLTAMLSGHAGV